MIRNNYGKRQKRGLEVFVWDNDIERAISRFKNLVSREGIIEEVRERQFYKKPSEKRREARAEGRKKAINKHNKLKKALVVNDLMGPKKLRKLRKKGNKRVER